MLAEMEWAALWHPWLSAWGSAFSSLLKQTGQQRLSLALALLPLDLSDKLAPPGQHKFIDHRGRIVKQTKNIKQIWPTDAKIKHLLWISTSYLVSKHMKGAKCPAIQRATTRNKAIRPHLSMKPRDALCPITSSLLQHLIPRARDESYG